MRRKRSYPYFEINHTDSLQIVMVSTTGRPIPFYPVKLSSGNGESKNLMVIAYTALHDCTVNIEDTYTTIGFDFTSTKNYDKKW